MSKIIADLKSPRFEIESGAPVSGAFGDVYFSRDGGPAEAEHVFLRGIGAPALWREKADVTIGETGFGTGLNFLVAVEQFLRTAPFESRLHFMSVEGFPLSPSEMLAAHDLLPETLRELSRDLRLALPSPVPGVHQRWLFNDRVSLTLGYGDAAETLAEMEAFADAWFLDGFAPARNPAMWRANVFRQIARLSVTGARLATFTVAGDVRRGLAEAGFELEKRPGFGRKRECLAARFTGRAKRPPEAPSKVTVIGDGIAGHSAVRALKRLGVAVDWQAPPDDRLAGSCVPRALISPRVASPRDVYGRFLNAAYLHAQETLRETPGVEVVGSLTLLEDRREKAERHLGEAGWSSELARLVDPAEASSAAGVDLPDWAVHAPGALMVEGRTLLAAIADQAGETPRPVVAAPDQKQGRVVLLANGLGALVWRPDLPLRAMGGQTITVASTPALAPLSVALHYGGYVTPARDGVHVIGSTYERNATPGDWTPDAAGPLTIAGKLRDRLPSLADGLDVSNAVNRWSGIRAATPDHLPILGPTGSADGEVWTLVGLGSRGFQTAPLCADSIAARIVGVPNPLPLSAGRS